MGLLQELPEDCKANIISLTSPQDACRLSLVSKNFKSTADSDDVWRSFLPPEILTILFESSAPDELAALPKKQIFRALCANPILIDDRTMSFSLDKSTGKKCYMISARQLTIIWSNTPRYWTWTPDPESRFEEVAKLLAVCWLQICGIINTSLLSPSTQYKAYLVFKFSADQTYGFEHLPAQGSVGVVRQEVRQTAYLHSREVVMNNNQYPKVRSDGWWEVELGELVFEEEERQLEMSLLETISRNWKGGLIIQGIEVRPRGIKY